MSKDPFRTAERMTKCPCGEWFLWNREDGIAGMTCFKCGHNYTGYERPSIAFDREIFNREVGGKR